MSVTWRSCRQVTGRLHRRDLSWRHVTSGGVQGGEVGADLVGFGQAEAGAKGYGVLKVQARAGLPRAWWA